jgi:hypothetical protein
MSDPQAAVRELQSRRRKRRDEAAAPREAPPSVDAPLTRRNPVLFDPSELPAVVEGGGYVPPAKLEHYSVAQRPATQQVYPDGCVTPVTRILWRKGQHVRTDVLEAYERAHAPQAATAGDTKPEAGANQG